MKKPKLAAELTDPRNNLDGFSVRNAIDEIESSVTDSGGFFARMERNERIRKCHWAGKDSSGRKRDKSNKKAKPWDGAADHEVHLAQEVLLQLTAQRVAAILRGAVRVTPMEGTDARAAGQMKLVMRYFLETAMRTERLVHGARWASWALRYGHAVMYIGWLTRKALERRTFTQSEVLAFVLKQLVAEQTDQAGPEGMAPVQPAELEATAMQKVLMAPDDELASWLLEMYPDLKARGKEAAAESLRAAKSLRAAQDSEDPEGYFYSVFVKENRPTWEALRQGVDFFCPAETTFTDNFDNARWLARVRWMSAQQIREEAVQRDWNPEWVMKVLKDCKGKARSFASRTASTPWALSGVGVGFASGQRRTMDAETHLYQIVEYYDTKVTADGVQCLYKTVLHPDVPGLVAKRELLEDWHGHFPFVPATSEMDEPVLMENRGVPEIVASPQGAVKVQWDSRDDMASMTTLPPWTGPENLEGYQIKPGCYIPEWQTGTVKAWKLPPPDGRSIEIENSLRAAVNRYYGLISTDVPDALSMLLGQVGTDWFLASYSRVVALTAQLVQQRMTRLQGARITGTEIVFSAAREDVRGQFDFQTKFDVRALDMDWTKQILEFVQGMIIPMDNREILNRRVFIELGVNMIDPSLADQAIRSDEEAEQGAIDDEDDQLTKIFSGGVPRFVVGDDHAARAQEMKVDLQRSPARQQILGANEMVAAVWEDRLQKHLFQMEQQANAVVGIQGGSDPLRQSPLAQLKAGGWQAVLAA